MDRRSACRDWPGARKLLGIVGFQGCVPPGSRLAIGNNGVRIRGGVRNSEIPIGGVRTLRVALIRRSSRDRHIPITLVRITDVRITVVHVVVVWVSAIRGGPGVSKIVL